MFFRYEIYLCSCQETGEVHVQAKSVKINQLDPWIRQGYPGVQVPLSINPGSHVVGVVETLRETTSLEWLGKCVLLFPGLFCGACSKYKDREHNLC
jgi:NADPH:quinone reductase-like Zn-dependent oxidoreductase